MTQGKRAVAGWSRRDFLKTAGVAAATLAFPEVIISCGTSGSTATATIPKPRKGASIRLLQWTSFVKPADAEFKRQAAEWGAANGVTVAIETVTGDQLQPKTAAAVEAGAGPDIIQMQYGWPQTDYFQQAGVSNFPTTWDELTAAAAKLKTTGKPISQTDGHAYGDSLTMWNPVLWGFGGKEVNADGKTVAINSKETREAIKWAKGAVQAGLVVHPEWLDPDNNQAYHADRVSGTLNGASIYIREKIEFHKYTDVTNNAPMPSGPKGTFAMNLIFNHAVMKWSPDAETARAMLLALMEKDQYQKWTLIASGYNAGPFEALHNDPVFASDPKLKAFQEVVAPGKWPGWPALPSKKTAQAQTQFIVADMFAKSLANGGTGDMEAAISAAETSLKAIFERP
ncbi:MAG: extracellular solute-binding protein [Chloroflexi bacterium]|nr:MAG: extracellular solute-binding protein [Chloroflexota bacterium]